MTRPTVATTRSSAIRHDGATPTRWHGPLGEVTVVLVPHAVLTDEALMAAAALGDGDALGELDRRHREAVRRALGRTSSAADLIDDALQDAFLALRSAAATGDWARPGAVPAFLLVVGARRVAQRHRDHAPRRASGAGNRDNAARRAAAATLGEDGDALDFSRPGDEPDDLDVWLASQVDALPAHYRDALVDQHLRGLTEVEAAEKRGTTAEAIKMVRYRARRRLLAELAENQPCPTKSNLTITPPQALVAPDPFVAVRRVDTQHAPRVPVVVKNAGGRALPARLARLEVTGPLRGAASVLQPVPTDHTGTSAGRVACSGPGRLSVAAALDPGRLATVRLAPVSVDFR
jgi:RNA polymerase sigma-70 factor (ECF subfamily)